MLQVHYNQGYLDSYLDREHIRQVDSSAYPPPTLISQNLTHEDVNLGMFVNDYRQRKIATMVAGARLHINDELTGCSYNGTQILYFDADYKKLLAQKRQEGFFPVCIRAEFIVYYKGKEWEKEMPIVLPVIEYERKLL